MNLSLLGLSGGMIALFVILAFIVLFVTKPLSFFWTYGNDAKEWAELFDEALAEQDQIELQKEQCVEALASVRAEEAMLEEQLGKQLFGHQLVARILQSIESIYVTTKSCLPAMN